MQVNSKKVYFSKIKHIDLQDFFYSCQLVLESSNMHMFECEYEENQFQDL